MNNRPLCTKCNNNDYKYYDGCLGYEAMFIWKAPQPEEIVRFNIFRNAVLNKGVRGYRELPNMQWLNKN